MHVLKKQRPLLLVLLVLALLLSFAGRPALAAEEMGAPDCEASEGTAGGPELVTETEEVPEYAGTDAAPAAEEEEPAPMQDVLPDVHEVPEDEDPALDAEKDAGTAAGEETEPCEAAEDGPAQENPAELSLEESVIPEMSGGPEPADVPEPAAAEESAEPAGDDGTSVAGEETGSDTPSPVQVTVVKENGEEFKMFKARSSTAALNGDMIDIVFITDNVSFDKIYVGSKNDAEKKDYFTGTQLENGGFRFEFSVDRALNGTRTEVALGKLDGSWYSGMTLYLVIPDLEDPESPDNPSEPEEPEDPETPDDPSGQDEPMISEDGVLADGIYSAEVETGQAMFKVVNCVITSEDGKMTAVITLSGTGYDYLYQGTAEEAYAADGEGWIPFQVDPETGKYTYTLKLTSVTEPVGVAARSARYASEGRGEAAWLNRTLTFVQESITRIAELPGGEDPETPDDPSGQDEPMISEDGVLADGIYSAEVETGQAMFKVVNCVITSEDGKMTAVITLSGTGYDYLYQGTAEEAYAADGEGWIPFQVDPETGKYTYTLELTSVTEPVGVAARSARYASEGRGEAAWLDRTLTFVQESITRIADLPDEDDPAEPSGPSDEPGNDSSGGEGKTDGSGKEGNTEPEKDEPENTGTQDEDEIRKMEENTKKGTVADGTYVPSFGFTGGTGKVTISCPKLVVRNGKGTATLVFSSSKYTYMLVNGTKYYNENPGGKSTFTIPVNVNGTTSVSAETTAMSEAHLIDYVLYIYVDGQDVSNIRPSAASDGADTDTDTEKEQAEKTEGSEEEEELGPDGKKKEGSGWGEYDSIQTKDEPAAEEEAAVPATGSEDTPPAPETEEPSGTGSFSAWFGVGIGAAVIAIAAGGFAVLRKGKKRT